MQIIENIIAALVPVAFIIALGYLAGKQGKLKPDDSLLLAKLVLTWIFPSLLLVGMANTPREQLLNYKFILATLVGMMGMYALGFLLGWLRFRSPLKATLKGFVVAFPDAAFMGIPIMHSLFGASSLYAILVLNLVASLLMIPLTTMLLDIGNGKGSGLSALPTSWGKMFVYVTNFKKMGYDGLIISS